MPVARGSWQGCLSARGELPRTCWPETTPETALTASWRCLHLVLKHWSQTFKHPLTFPSESQSRAPPASLPGSLPVCQAHGHRSVPGGGGGGRGWRRLAVSNRGGGGRGKDQDDALSQDRRLQERGGCRLQASGCWDQLVPFLSIQPQISTPYPISDTFLFGRRHHTFPSHFSSPDRKRRGTRRKRHKHVGFFSMSPLFLGPHLTRRQKRW